MTNTEKLSRLKIILGKCSLEDSVLEEYLSLAQDEIINYIHTLTGNEVSHTLPPQYDQVQIMSVVFGINQRGGEGETNHIENGIERNFEYGDMLHYIHRNVVPYVGVR